MTGDDKASFVRIRRRQFIAVLAIVVCVLVVFTLALWW